ncbi:MAG TPA: hypothetical protein VHD85_15500 [Terracidiphilus sp.]|jgi:hypothetical protein|nr:hypothetical protein [Terracidiphilus sp.]
MNTHPYLRAYLAGVFVPTLVLPLILIVFITVRLVLAASFPIERFLIFPMSIVPTFFGLWNMLYLASHERTHLQIGLHGAILPFLGAPTGALVAHWLGILKIGESGVTWFNACHVPYAFVGVIFLAGVAAYYLVWKYIVGAINQVLGIAG